MFASPNVVRLSNSARVGGRRFGNRLADIDLALSYGTECEDATLPTEADAPSVDDVNASGDRPARANLRNPLRTARRAQPIGRAA